MELGLRMEWEGRMKQRQQCNATQRNRGIASLARLIDGLTSHHPACVGLFSHSSQPHALLLLLLLLLLAGGADDAYRITTPCLHRPPSACVCIGA